MKISNESMVDDGIEEQKKSGETQRVGLFIKGVEKRVEAKVNALRDIYGDAVEDVAGEAMSEVAGYKEAQLKLFDPHFNVKNTEAKGAAAWNEKGGDNSIAVGHSAMDRSKDEGYWRRVAKHEIVHQQEQVVQYNRASIGYPDDRDMQVSPVLVEWHAITQANQPDTDLTPDYISHKRRGDALARFLGGPERIIAALKSGDMQALQDYIEEKLAAAQPFEQVDVPEPSYAVAA